MTTARVSVAIGKTVFDRTTTVAIARDLQNIAGTFDITVLDDARLWNALRVYLGRRPEAEPIKAGDAVSVAIDGEAALVGWIDKASFRWDGERIECRIAGRDKTGDLADCAALPDGPAEFRNVDLLHVAKKVCEPYGIPVRAEADIGAPFALLSLHPHQTALAFLESASRQRSNLLISDGIGGLLLTRGGATKAPAPLRIGENIREIAADFDWTHRFSHYFVKQQAARGHGGGGAALDHSVAPDGDHEDGGGHGEGEHSRAEARRIVATGRAIDPDMKRYRPTVRLTRTQSGMSSVQEQAEWMLRVARGQSDSLRIEALDWRAGPKDALWRPNAVAEVWDPYSGIDREMLIAGVAYKFDERGYRTEMRVVGRDAYDRIDEAERRRGRHHTQPRSLDSSVVPLQATEKPK